MSDKAQDPKPVNNIADEQLEEVAGGNSIHKHQIEELETYDSSKNGKDINIQQIRLDELDRRDGGSK